MGQVPPKFAPLKDSVSLQEKWLAWRDNGIRPPESDIKTIEAMVAHEWKVFAMNPAYLPPPPKMLDPDEDCTRPFGVSERRYQQLLEKKRAEYSAWLERQPLTHTSKEKPCGAHYTKHTIDEWCAGRVNGNQWFIPERTR